MFKSKPFKWFAGIFGTVVVAALSALVTQWVTDKSPEIIVRQYYNVVDAAEVPQKVGDLLISYDVTPGLPRPFGARNDSDGVYLIEIANNGNAPEEDLRVQAGFPTGVNFSYYKKAPDLRVYQPEEIKLDGDGFFMALKSFPKDALAAVSFVPPEDKKALCDVKVRPAGRRSAALILSSSPR